MTTSISIEVVGKLQRLAGDLGHGGVSADVIVEVLREAILSRVLPPGQSLVEKDLSSIFQVSRTPVREAVLRLEAERLVVRRGRRGVIVGDISPSEVAEVYHVRRVLDGLACELAAVRASPPEIAELRWINDLLRESGERGELQELPALNFRFHEAMGRASKSSYLLMCMKQVQNHVRWFSMSTLELPDRWKEVIQEHKIIVEAIEARDSEQARDAAEAHMRKARLVRIHMIESQKGAE